MATELKAMLEEMLAKQWQRQTQLMHNLETRLNAKIASQAPSASPPGTPCEGEPISRSQSTASTYSSSSSLASPPLNKQKKQRRRKKTALAVGKLARLKKKRKSSPRPDAILRKALGDALCRLEPKLRMKRCVYYNIQGDNEQFDEKKFEADGRLALQEAMGSNYDVDIPKTEAAFQTACDIVKRRRKYLRKHPNAKVKRKRSELAVAARKKAKQSTDELDDLSFAVVKKESEDDEDDEDGEDGEDDEDDEDGEDASLITYACLDCEVPLTLDKCYPVTARQDPANIFFRCKKCEHKLELEMRQHEAYTQRARRERKEELNERKEEAAAKAKKAANATKGKKATTATATKGKKATRGRGKKATTATTTKGKKATTATTTKGKKATAATATKGKNATRGRGKKATTATTTKNATRGRGKKATTATTTKNATRGRGKKAIIDKPIFRYDLYENVHAYWPSHDCFYRAQISHRTVGPNMTPLYHVYFPDDSEPRDFVTEEEITPTDEVDGFWSLTRDRFIGQRYTHDGRGGGARLKGVLQITGIGISKRINKYVCEREDGKKCYLDVGYVLRALAARDFKISS